VDSDSGPGGPGAERDRTVARALARLTSLTAPTEAERARIRARILRGLDAPETEAPRTTVTATTAQVSEPAEAAPAGSATAQAAARTVEPSGKAAAARVVPSRPPGSRAGRAPRGRRSSGRSGGRSGGPPRALSGARARFAVASVAVLALIGCLAGMSLLLARDALPGDALYGIKRTAEAASLGMTFGDESKALKHLEFAAARVGEIETLARRYPDPDDAPVGGYLTALTDFDNDAAAGSRQLIALATSTDGSQLESLRTWARQQASRLDGVTTRLPAAARNRQRTSLDLLDRMTARSSALLARMDCDQITSGSHDDIGALPATASCATDAGITAPILPTDTDSSERPSEPPATGGPVAPSEPTPELPIPVPPITLSTAPPTGRPGALPTTPPSDSPEIAVPLPLPTVELPPLLPGLPGIRIGE
jgi:hypothetical protein